MEAKIHGRITDFSHFYPDAKIYLTPLTHRPMP